jgi:hemerythrin-like domain-containing protein
MTPQPLRRRELLRGGFAVGSGLAAVSLLPAQASAEEKEVSAVEDLMREHGILRRALLVYSECTSRLRGPSAQVDPGALNRTAQLFRSFGEQYHEKQLEEGFIFPALRARRVDGQLRGRAHGAACARSRDHVLSPRYDDQGRISDPALLAVVLDGFVRMYRHHAAREDTIVFPAWKEALSERQLDELGEKFEEIEKSQFGGDGFDRAARQMADIEVALGLEDLARFTAPPPPKG